MEYQSRFIEKYISAVQYVWSFEEEHRWKLAKVNYQDSPKLLKTYGQNLLSMVKVLGQCSLTQFLMVSTT